MQVGSLAGGKRESWTERLMPLRDFIERHVLREAHVFTKARVNGGIDSGLDESGGDGDGGDEGGGCEGIALGYLAQHPLFEQLPTLRADFRPPAACGSDVQHMNAWMGPAGTVTPLHYDSYDNILTQVVGYKLVRLYEGSQTACLYPEEGGGGGIAAQGNVGRPSAISM